MLAQLVYYCLTAYYCQLLEVEVGFEAKNSIFQPWGHMHHLQAQIWHIIVYVKTSSSDRIPLRLTWGWVEVLLGFWQKQMHPWKPEIVLEKLLMIKRLTVYKDCIITSLLICNVVPWQYKWTMEYSPRGYKPLSRVPVSDMNYGDEGGITDIRDLTGSC